MHDSAAGFSIVRSILGDRAASIEARIEAEREAERAGRPDPIEIWCDGLCEPINPGGIATYGFVVKRGGELLASESGEVCRGPEATNNVAEYAAVSLALEWVISSAPKGVPVVIRTDSALVVNQIAGAYAVRSERIVPLYRRATRLLAEARRSGSVQLAWVSRSANAEADRLTRVAYAAADEVGRVERAERAAGLVVEDCGTAGRYRVRSASGSGTYDVDAMRGTCACPDYQRRGVDCKHLIAAKRVEAGGERAERAGGT